MRRFRWQRLTQALVARDYGGLLMFDPMNIRYATDTTNMQLWNAHNPFRAVLLCADGHMCIWEYKNSPFLVAFNPLIAEMRHGASFFYSITGDKGVAAAESFAGQVDEVMRAHAGSNRRLAVDKIMVAGLRTLEAAGFEVMEGEEVTERARAVKGPEDIAAMRCAHLACEAAIARDGGLCAVRSAKGPRQRGCDLGGTARRQHPARRRMDRDAAAWPPARAPTRGSRNAGRVSCRRTRSSPSTPT